MDHGTNSVSHILIVGPQKATPQCEHEVGTECSLTCQPKGDSIVTIRVKPACACPSTILCLT
eukprot:2848154-Amphidinium_carterae.1